MKRTISYVSYAAAALALMALALLKLPHQVDIGLGLLFAMAFGVGNTNRMLAKWEKDGAYQKEALDERNIAIKERPAISPACLLQHCWEFPLWFLCVWAIQFRRSW